MRRSGRNTRLRRATAVAVLAVILAIPSAAMATVPGFNGKIVFSAFPDSCESNCGRFVRLFTINPDGSGLTQIGTQLPMSEMSDQYDEGARFSPDGARIGFTRNALDQTGSIIGADAYTMRADGSGEQLVRNGRWFIAWLPNGRIALEDPYTGAKSTVAADGSDEQPLGGLANTSSLTWSPDGTHVAFERFSDIWVMNADTFAQTDLTQTPGLGDGGPTWAPDGAAIAFRCQIPLYVNVCSIAADGSAPPRSLTNVTLPDQATGPVYSPDGTRIAYRQGRDFVFRLWTMAPNGGDRAPVPGLSLRVNDLDWQPLHADFSPFARPIDPDAVNRVNAGRTVPIKFTLGQDLGLDIFADGYPRSTAVPCGSDPDETDIAGVARTETTHLTYDAATGQYTYLWRTDSAWRGCRALTLKLRDGSVRTALFRSH